MQPSNAMRAFRISLAVMLILSSSFAGAAVRLASFNIQHLGYNNGKDIAALAQIVSRFDLVGVQEVMNKEVVDTLEQALERETDTAWASLTSDAVGRSSYREHYAFFWREKAVGFEGSAVQYLDPGDIFAREPLSAMFRDKETDQIFTYATVHIVYGHSRAERRVEIRALNEYHDWLEETFDEPMIMAGDFNMPPTDTSWRQLKGVLKPMITSGATTLSPKNGRYANLYDNIWLDPASFDVTSRGIVQFPTWLGLTHKQARDSVSDHAPIYVTFGDVRVDTTPLRTSRTTQSGSDSTQRACVDVNRASADRLETLPQVGPSRAQDIISGRPWRSLDGLTKISGLGPARVKAIAQQACPSG